MTNKTLDKILNTGKKIVASAAIVGASYLGFNSINQANAQVSTLNEKGSSTETRVLQKDMLNAYDIPGYVIIDKTGKTEPTIETVRVYPTFSTMRGNNELIPRLVYSPIKAQVDGKDVDVIKYRTDEKDKKSIEELFQKKGTGGGVIQLSATEAQVVGFHTITTDNGTFVYFPIDTTETSLDEEKKQKVKEGKTIGVIFPADNMVIYEDINPKDRSVEYLVGKPNQVYYLDLNESEITDQALNKEGTELLDSLGRKYLSSKDAENIYLGGDLVKGMAYEFKNFSFLDGQGETKKEKTKANVNGRLKLGAAYMTPNGYIAFVNPQLKVGDKTYVGLTGFYSKSGRTLEEMSQEDGFTQLINAPLEMYFVNTGADINKNTQINTKFGAGTNFTYLGNNWELNLEAGILQQNVEETMTSEGEEYMTIGGAIDSTSIVPYNETNINESKGTPVYVKAGFEYFPFKGKNLGPLDKASLFIDAGYVTGEHKGAFAQAGLKYTFGGNKTEKTE